jgi:hypothetical protein
MRVFGVEWGTVNGRRACLQKVPVDRHSGHTKGGLSMGMSPRLKSSGSAAGGGSAHRRRSPQRAVVWPQVGSRVVAAAAAKPVCKPAAPGRGGVGAGGVDGGKAGAGRGQPGPVGLFT